jgi:PleD family two-component response regulator
LILSKLSYIPSIVLTGSSNKEDVFRGKNIVDYVIKDGRFAYEYIVNLVKRIVVNHNLKVLVVDDSVVAAKHAIELLKRYKLICFYAKDGIEALEILEKEKDIKIIFTDYTMPNLDGLELTKRVRKKYSKDELSIITITDSSDHKTVAKFLKFGANDFLYKGFSNEEFYARLNSDLEMLELFEDIKYKANRDYLTGMYNRRFFFDEGAKLFQQALRNNSNRCVAMFDIDKFKNINDTYGHDIGDIAIKKVAIVVDKYFGENAII